MSETVARSPCESCRATTRSVPRGRDRQQGHFPIARCDRERPGAVVPTSARLPPLAGSFARPYLSPCARDPGSTARPYQQVRSSSNHRWSPFGRSNATACHTKGERGERRPAATENPGQCVRSDRGSSTLSNVSCREASHVAYSDRMLSECQ